MATAVKHCDYCGTWVDTIRRASDDTEVVVNAHPHERGDWLRLNGDGPERGKYVRLSGRDLSLARAEGIILYIAHGEVCRRG